MVMGSPNEAVQLTSEKRYTLTSPTEDPEQHSTTTQNSNTATGIDVKGRSGVIMEIVKEGMVVVVVVEGRDGVR
jgi:hypothetical protein